MSLVTIRHSVIQEVFNNVMVFIYNEADSALCSIFKEKYPFVILNELFYQPNSELTKYILKPLFLEASVPTQTIMH